MKIRMEWQIKSWLAVGILFLISGCAISPAAPLSIRQTEANSWSGRVAVRVDGVSPKSFAASFELQGNAENGRLRLLSPLGATLGEIAWQPGVAYWKTPRDEKTFPSISVLTQSVTGASLPLPCLFSWLQEKTCDAPNWQVDLTEFNQGKVVAKRDVPLPRAELIVLLAH